MMFEPQGSSSPEFRKSICYLHILGEADGAQNPEIFLANP